MKITEIRQAANNKNRAHIYLDGEYRLTLPLSDIAEFSLAVGAELSDALLKRLEQTALYKNAFRDALKMLSRADCPGKKIREKLTQKDYPDSVVEQVIGELTQKGYLNDYEYAKKYIETAIVSKKKGKAYIELELYKKGIDRETISELLEQNYRSDGIFPVARAKLTALKRKELSPDKTFQKLKEYLFRQGFSVGEIRLAVNELAGKDLDEE